MRAAVLRPGDLVRYDGADHQVVALAGTSVRLRSDDGADSVVLVAYLMASPEFAVIDGAPAPWVEPFGLLEGLSVKVLEEAREWERHIVEVETGLPPNPLPGARGRNGVAAQPAAPWKAPSWLRPCENDDRREGPSQGGRVGREPAYGA